MRVIAVFLVNTLCNFAIGLLVAKFLGPEEFGKFALTLAVAMAMQVALFEWIRQATVRFYSQRSRREQPEFGATLDTSFALVATLASALIIGAMLLGLELPMSNALLGLALAAAIANGLFDYNTAMVRARFDDALYGRLILTKNLVALIFTAGGALIFHSASWALCGVCVSMVGSVFAYKSRLRDRALAFLPPSRAIAGDCLRYAAPIVIANLLYFGMPLANRALMAHWYGYAETGQFSLAFDIGTRVVASIGSTLDVLLFQMAVRADEQHGEQHGRAQVARNMAIVFAVLAPVCAGAWLTVPSLEQIAVPQQFRGPFADYFSLVLPGLFASGLLWFAINPVFQIAKRTTPMIVGAVVACCVDATLVACLPATPASLAIAQSCATLIGAATLIGYAAYAGALFPPARDLVGALLGCGAMLIALTPMRGAAPGLATLATQVLLGVAIYGACVIGFDVAGFRQLADTLARQLRARIARQAPGE